MTALWGLIILWGGVGGFDWIYDTVDCWNVMEMEYLKTIQQNYTSIEYLKDINSGLNEQVKDYINEIKLLTENDDLLMKKIQVIEKDYKNLSINHGLLNLEKNNLEIRIQGLEFENKNLKNEITGVKKSFEIYKMSQNLNK